MIKTYSKFYYGLVITQENQVLDFVEDGVAKQAILRFGSYTLAGLADEVARALNAAGEQVYQVSINRATRLVTIEASGAFSLLVSTGGAVFSSVFPLLGYTGVDRSGDDSYVGNIPCGVEYVPPFMLQSYLDSSDNVESVDYAQVESCTGEIQAVSFGEKRFTEFNITWVRAENYSDGLITTTTESVNELRQFMDYARKKNLIEFIKDRNNPGEFEVIRLESTPDSQNGSGFRLKELYDQGLPGFYESGVIKFRVIE